MNVLYKYIIFLLLLSFTTNSFAQYDDDDEDLEFKALKTKKRKESNLGGEKRRFNIHLETGYSLATVFGAGVLNLQDTLDKYQNLYNFDSFEVEPTFFPYARVNASFNFGEVSSMTVGLQFNRLGWKEIAKVDRTNVKYRFYNRVEFYYVGVPVAINFHIGKHFSFNFGNNYSFLVKNDLHTYEYFMQNGVTRIDKTQRQTFEDAFGFKAAPFIMQTFLGVNAGTKKVRFHVNVSTTLNFMHIQIPFSSVAVEAGILFKIFNDYE